MSLAPDLRHFEVNQNSTKSVPDPLTPTIYFCVHEKLRIHSKIAFWVHFLAPLQGANLLDARQVPWFPILVFGALIFNMIPPPLSPSSDSNRHQILSQSPVASASESDQILNQVAVDSGPESDQILNRDPTGI